MQSPLLPILFAVILTGSAEASQPKHGAKWVVGVSQCNLGEPWRVQMNEDIKKEAASHPDLTLIFKDAQNDTLQQRSQIEEFVNADVDLLIVSPKEAAPLTQPIAEAYRGGIPVIVLDRKVLGDAFTEFIGANNRLIGRAAGAWAVKRVAELARNRGPGARGKIVELKGLMTSTPGQDRSAGFRSALQGEPVDVIFEADMKWLEPQARIEMESALAVHPDIDLVYAHNDPGAHGAYLAAKAAGREKSIVFIGIDGLPQGGQIYVREGLLEASFEYPTGGREAVDNADKLLHGGDIPKQVTLRSHVYTRDNIARGGEWLP